MPLRVPTVLKPSNLHGLGVFALAPIKKDEIIWQHDAIFDGWIHRNLMNKADPSYHEIRKYVEYFYRYDEEIDCYIKTCDIMCWINYSKTPNIMITNKYLYVASRDIEIDEELTLEE